MNKPLSPIERMIDNSNLKCTICKAKIGNCDCWTKCKIDGCKWSFEKGTKCNNPEHKKL